MWITRITAVPPLPVLMDGWEKREKLSRFDTFLVRGGSCNAVLTTESFLDNAAVVRTHALRVGLT
jgi:hypothetical protein